MAKLPASMRAAMTAAEAHGESRYWAHSRIAAQWAEFGNAVIPLEKKAPIHREWQNTDPLEPGEAEKLWAPGGRFHDYEIGVVTGTVWVVIDLDVKGDFNGIKEFRKICARLGEDWPDTLTVRTPSGGMHLVFDAPEGHEIGCSVGSKTAGLGPGIDIRGWGGQIVAPGSRTGAGLYEVTEDRTPATLPAWLHEFITEKLRRVVKSDPMTETLEEGTRDTVLASVAGSMRRRGAEPDEILAALEVINENRCRPKKPHRDLERIAESIGNRPYEKEIAPEQTVEVDPKEFNASVTRLETERVAKKWMADQESRRRREVLGGHDSFRSILDCAADLPDPTEACIWGNKVIAGTTGWIRGEGLLIFGPTGSHKSTLAQHLAMRRCGAVTSPLFDLPVEIQHDGKVGYFALDRYPQIVRSIQRMWEQGVIDDRSKLYSNFHAIDCLPLNVSPFEPADFVGWLKGQEITTVVMDSYKDLGLDPNKGEHMLALNDLMQATLRAGIEWIGLHHTRKRARGDRKLLDTEDASGSSWVTAGVGSSIVMDKMSEDSKTRIRHSKTPSTPIESMIVQVYRDTAAMEVLVRGEEAEQLEEEPDGRNGGRFATTDNAISTRMIEYLEAHGDATAIEIAENLQESAESVRSAGRRLSTQNIVKLTRSGSERRWSLVVETEPDSGIA